MTFGTWPSNCIPYKKQQPKDLMICPDWASSKLKNDCKPYINEIQYSWIETAYLENHLRSKENVHQAQHGKHRHGREKCT